MASKELPPQSNQLVPTLEEARYQKSRDVFAATKIIHKARTAAENNEEEGTFPGLEVLAEAGFSDDRAPYDVLNKAFTTTVEDAQNDMWKAEKKNAIPELIYRPMSTSYRWRK